MEEYHIGTGKHDKRITLWEEPKYPISLDVIQIVADVIALFDN